MNKGRKEKRGQKKQKEISAVCLRAAAGRKWLHECFKIAVGL